MPHTERLFLGLHLYPLFEREISDIFLRLRPLYFDQKWVNIHHVHWTLHFFGELDSAQKQKVIEISERETRNQKPFEIALQGIDAFPDKTKPRIVWAGSSKKHLQAAAEFQKKISKAMIDAGFPADRDTWTPHATLFRITSGAKLEWDDKLLAFSETKPQIVKELVLFKSILKPAGSEYEPCHVFPFRGRVY